MAVIEADLAVVGCGATKRPGLMMELTVAGA